MFNHMTTFSISSPPKAYALIPSSWQGASWFLNASAVDLSCRRFVPPKLSCSFLWNAGGGVRVRHSGFEFEANAWDDLTHMLTMAYETSGLQHIMPAAAATALFRLTGDIGTKPSQAKLPLMVTSVA